MSNHLRKQSDEDVPNKPDANGVCADEEAGSDLYDDEDSTLKRADSDVERVASDAATPEQNQISQNDADADEESEISPPPAIKDGEPDPDKHRKQHVQGQSAEDRKQKSDTSGTASRSGTDLKQGSGKRPGQDSAKR